MSLARLHEASRSRLTLRWRRRGGRFSLTRFCTGVSLVSRVWTVLTDEVRVRSMLIYLSLIGVTVVATSYHHG
ncbi:hypothetical protein KCP78_04165 [Salmonella enterica subsp. enterica]|nr:hypothetical protein KCP78_04165 [Salmonella enterica subsp. enterica]